jgi:hypothetical protein
MNLSSLSRRLSQLESSRLDNLSQLSDEELVSRFTKTETVTFTVASLFRKWKADSPEWEIPGWMQEVVHQADAAEESWRRMMEEYDRRLAVCNTDGLKQKAEDLAFRVRMDDEDLGLFQTELVRLQ